MADDRMVVDTAQSLSPMGGNPMISDNPTEEAVRATSPRLSHSNSPTAPPSQNMSPSNSSTIPELCLPAGQVDTVCSKLEREARVKRWKLIFDTSDDESEDMKSLKSTVFHTIVRFLSNTDLKDKILSMSDEDDAPDILDKFTGQEREMFKEGLKKGVIYNKWEDLLKHPKLLRPATNKTAMGVPIELQNAVINAWGAPYRGESAKSLLELIDFYYKQPLSQGYARIVPIVQSSGTGKSKTVDEIARTRILFPLCLREDIGDRCFAYPPVDKGVRDYILSAPSVSDEEDCKMHLSAVIGAIFCEAEKQIWSFAEKAAKQDPDFATDAAKRPSYKDLAEKNYAFFSDQSNRDNFYRRVVNKAPSFRMPSYSLLDSAMSLKRTLEACLQWHEEHQQPSWNFFPILLSMDEVHTLFERRKIDGRSRDSLYTRIMSVLRQIRTQPFFTIFLSTASIVSGLAPAQEIPPSFREKSDVLMLPTPFTELPFDVDLIDNPLVPKKESIHSVGSLKFTVQFGRPLFSATYRSRRREDNDDVALAADMLDITMDKLCGFTWPPTKAATLNTSSIAVLSARFLLELSPATPQARTFDEEQIRSHLRMLYSVQRDGQVIVAGSSPEPLIAEAAAKIMHSPLQDSNVPYMDIWALLGKFIDDGLAPQGTTGQLIGRVLSILAMDRAIHLLPPWEWCQLKYQTPITVAAYYKALLTDDAWEKLRLSVPENYSDLCEQAGCMTFEDAFRDAYLRFSHYAKANDDTPFKNQYAWALWLRGTAICGQLNQQLSDRGLPIHFTSEGNVGPRSMSMILDQDKTGQSENSSPVKDRSAATLGLFSGGQKHLPYIDAVHCYALEADQGIALTPSRDERRYKAENEEAPRYRINLRGLHVYRDVQSVAKNIRSMMDGAKNSLFKHHPHQQNLPLLRKMQPLLNGMTETTEWFGGFR